MHRTVIVGCGPVGSVLACFLSVEGFDVEVFECMPDPRKTTCKTARSINLTLCKRGLDAIDAIGAGAEVRALSVAVYGRLIHDRQGGLTYQPYGNRGEAIYSIGRADLNRVLLTHAECRSNVQIHFNRKCVQVDPDKPAVELKGSDSGDTRAQSADCIFGVDGVHSAVRAGLQRKVRMDLSIRYCKQGYKEIPISAGNGGWAAKQNVIHVWPRGDYMLIGFPNSDGGFTCSLHLPFEGPVSFQAIQTKDDLRRLFSESFQDAADLVSGFVEDLFETPPNSMITVKCSPWSHAGKVAILGDAAHSIYPSYGQGANAGFEDCAVLVDCLRNYGDPAAALREFEERRRPNTDVIADLCADHFEELQTLAGTPYFLTRKTIERRLNQLYPDAYRDLYSMITFTTMPYREALEIDRKQRTVLDSLARVDGIEGKLYTAELAALMQRLMAERIANGPAIA